MTTPTPDQIHEPHSGARDHGALVCVICGGFSYTRHCWLCVRNLAEVDPMTAERLAEIRNHNPGSAAEAIAALLNEITRLKSENERLQSLVEFTDMESTAHAEISVKDCAEIERLKSGNFTPEEFQNLCHNFSEEDEEAFGEGCVAHQCKLFGRSLLKDLVIESQNTAAVAIQEAWRLREEIASLKQLLRDFPSENLAHDLPSSMRQKTTAWLDARQKAVGE